MANLRPSPLKFGLTLVASAISVGPLSVLTLNNVLPILQAILGEECMKWLSNQAEEIINNLTGDYAKEILDALEKDPPQELQRIWVLALHQALIDARQKFRKEYGERLPIIGERTLPGDQEQFFTNCLARLEILLSDKIDLEIQLRDKPALEAIYNDDHSAGWSFLESNLTEWAGKVGFPDELKGHLKLELRGILSDRFSTQLSSPQYQQAFNKHQAHFSHILLRGINELHLKVDTANEGIDQLNRKADQADQKLDELRDSVRRLIENVLKQSTATQTDLTEFRQGIIKEWSQDRYQLDKRFVGLTLAIFRGEKDKQELQQEDDRFTDLREVLQKVEERYKTRVIALLGKPGSGKSTLLRRMQLDHSLDRLKDGKDEVSLFVQLNHYRAPENGVLPDPAAWLEAKWNDSYPKLGSLSEYLGNGKVLLLLDALNEMPWKDNAHYINLVSLWRSFAQSVASKGNRIVFSCRSLDYSAPLNSDDLTVPQVNLMSMTSDQVQAFLRSYVPEHQIRVWEQFKNSPKQFELYQTPYFLKLLCDQIEEINEVPKGIVELFTGFVRCALDRELKRGNNLLSPDWLLDRRDHVKSTKNTWDSQFELPTNGEMFPRLSRLAFSMQDSKKETERTHIRITFTEALGYINHDKADEVIRAGATLNILDEDEKKGQLLFFHQLLQEYFAARKLALNPEPSRVHVEWDIGKVGKSLEDEIAGLAAGEPLPPLPQTGWVETTLMAVPMAKDPEGYIRMLMEENLPLAARCAISAEVVVKEELKQQIRVALVGRTQDMKADLRARIAAGEALGLIGDPRWKEITNERGSCLEPPMVRIAAGRYPIGDDHSIFTRERPAHEVELREYEIGVFPVTNAEYARFIEAGGYEQTEWWETREAKRWLSEGGSESQKQSLRDERWRWQNNWTDEQIRALVGQNRAAPQQVENWLWRRNATDEEFESVLAQVFPGAVLYRQPRYWEDSAYNNSLQPVVGVSWYEARAYCKWLSGVTGEEYRLPTEVEYEAAARGAEGRKYAYGEEFDSAKCNTFESHIRRPTPVGIFENRTPEGAYDMTGNVWTWTTTIYDEEKYGYRYQAEDGREELEEREAEEEGSGGEKSGQAAIRVFRGGSWDCDAVSCRSAYRGRYTPGGRNDDLGFRLSRTLP